jgi:hypothetical protein
MQQPKMGSFSTPTEFLTTILCALLLLVVGERGTKPSMVTVIAYVALASAAYIVVLDTAEKEQGTFRCVRSTARTSCVTGSDPDFDTKLVSLFFFCRTQREQGRTTNVRGRCPEVIYHKHVCLLAAEFGTLAVWRLVQAGILECSSSLVVPINTNAFNKKLPLLSPLLSFPISLLTGRRQGSLVATVWGAVRHTLRTILSSSESRAIFYFLALNLTFMFVCAAHPQSCVCIAGHRAQYHLSPCCLGMR